MLATDATPQRRVNPTRAARYAARATQERGLSTKAQEALKQLQEQQKQERQTTSREHAAHTREKAHAKALARRRGH